MNGRDFSLKPFPSSGPLPGLDITGGIVRCSDALTVRYALHGPLPELVIPSPAHLPARKNLLWEETCFEFFLAPRNHRRYWEFNISPAGHWNVYSFKSYRQGMKEEPAITSLPIVVRSGRDALQLSVRLDLAGIVPPSQILKAAVSAVVKSKNGGTTYWALIHPAAEADFHLRDGFTLEL